MDYEKYLQERLEGMYEAYESPILEAFKNEKTEKEIKLHRKRFIGYLEYKYRDKNIRHEIRAAKTPEEKKALVNKYMDDYKEWKKRDKIAIGLGVTQVANAVLNVTGVISNPVFAIVSLLLLGGYGKAMHSDLKARNDADFKKYQQNKKEGEK